MEALEGEIVAGLNGTCTGTTVEFRTVGAVVSVTLHHAPGDRDLAVAEAKNAVRRVASACTPIRAAMRRDGGLNGDVFGAWAYRAG